MAISVFIASTSLAADYYVSPSGTEAWPSCTTSVNPCLASNSTAGRAFLAAKAGDTVWFLDGVYSGIEPDLTINYRYPAWPPQNSGTAASPITFRAINRGSVTLRGLVDGVLCGVIGAYDEDYIVWDGFNIEAVNSTGGKILSGAKFIDSTGSKLTNCNIIGSSHSTGGAVNYEGLRLEGASDFLAANCTIRDIIETGDNHNTSAVKTFNTTNATITNCEIYNSTCGVYIKNSGNSYITVQNCFVSDIAGGGVIVDPSTGYNRSISLINNIFLSCGTIFDATSDCVVDDSLDGILIHDNTVYDSNSGFTWTTRYSVGNGPKIYNNIISATSHIASRNACTTEGAKEIDHNCYTGWSFRATMNLYDASETVYTNFATWQSSGELSGGVNPDAGSITGSPLFANTSGSMSEIADFALQSGSPCSGAGRGGVDIGADVTLVGVLLADGDTDPDPIPTTTGPVPSFGGRLLSTGGRILVFQ